MFQYAAARAVAIRCGADLVLDLSWFGTVADRHYALEPFRVNSRIQGGGQAAHGAATRILKKIAFELTKKSGKYKQGVPVFQEKHFHFDPKVLNVQAPVCMDGYFQSEKYFADCHSAIAAEFTLAQPPGVLAQEMLEKISASQSICLHVRRGDYVTNAAANAFHGTCSLDYYREGLRRVSEGLLNPHCFVFSDDPEWVRTNFRPALPITVVDINGPEDAHEDIRLMMECKHFVIANSSFSWWGAWLGRAENKRVVAPVQWFHDSRNDTKDLIPEQWQRI